MSDILYSDQEMVDAGIYLPSLPDVTFSIGSNRGAKAASLTDDEAVALWDKLLSGLKFRVKVPGAPQRSYFVPPDHPNVAEAGK